jgi:hypothetical protein
MNDEATYTSSQQEMLQSIFTDGMTDAEREWFLKESHRMRFQLMEGFKDKGLPEYMLGAVRFVMTGRAVGDFLTALFSNDLMMAVCRADENNELLLKNWCKWLYNDCPGFTPWTTNDGREKHARPFGSKKEFIKWQSLEGWDGILCRRIQQMRVKEAEMAAKDKAQYERIAEEGYKGE